MVVDWVFEFVRTVNCLWCVSSIVYWSLIVIIVIVIDRLIIESNTNTIIINIEHELCCVPCVSISIF